MKQTREIYFCDLCKKETSIQRMKIPVYRTFDANDGRTFYKDKQFENVELDICRNCLEEITKVHSIGVCCEEYKIERGIKVCKEWRCLNNFVDWAYKNGYIEKDKANRKEVLSIERIDVNGNYEPNNCKWIPFCEQGKNKRYSGRQCVGRKIKE